MVSPDFFFADGGPFDPSSYNPVDPGVALVTEDDIKKAAVMSITGGIADIPISPDMLTHAMDLTRMWFATIGQKIFYPIDITRTTTIYDLPRHLFKVYDVVVSDSLDYETASETIDPLNLQLLFANSLIRGGGGLPGPNFGSMPISRLMQYKTYYEEGRRALGLTVTWRQRRGIKGNIQLIIDSFQANGLAMVHAATNNIEFERIIDPGDVLIVIKRMEANILKQLGSAFVNMGGNIRIGDNEIELDGQGFLDRSQEMFEESEELASKYRASSALNVPPSGKA